MADLHPHAAVIDRIGKVRVYRHYNISPQAVGQWRKVGVPKMHHKSLALLALVNGEAYGELDA